MPKVADNANDNVAEPVKEERKFRYLRKWSKWNKDTSYHLSHKPRWVRIKVYKK